MYLYGSFPVCVPGTFLNDDLRHDRARGPDMGHLVIVQQKPRYCASDDCEFPLKTSQNWADFKKYRFHRSGCTVILFIRRPGIGST